MRRPAGATPEGETSPMQPMPPNPPRRWPAALLLLAACTAGREAPVPPGRPAAPAGARVRRGTLVDRFLLTGELRAVRTQALAAPRTPVWSVTIRWLAPEGSLVKVGDPVVQFDTSSLQADLEDKRLAVAEADRELAKARAEVAGGQEEKDLARLQARVVRDVAAIDAAVPAELMPLRDHQEKQLALESAQAALAKAERERDTKQAGTAAQIEVLTLRLAKARRDLERSETTLASLTLRAPADGVLIHGTHPWEGRKWQEGDNAFPGMTIVEVPDLNAMEVEALLSDVDDGQVLPGMEVGSILDAFPGRVFPGTVREVSEVADELGGRAGRRFFLVRIELGSVDPQVMRPGMSVKAEVIRRRLEETLLVPRAALDLAADPPRLRLPGREPEAVKLAACDAIDCALATGPPEGTPVGEGP